MASYLINVVPGIERKSYLEIGAFQQHTFRAVQASHKVCVDPVHPATFQGTSDEFFKQNREKFDVVYIDGCHEAGVVQRDFNNSVAILNPGGYIFLHDLYPQTEDLIKPWYCGDAYKFLDAAHKVNYPGVYTQDSDYGLTVFINPVSQVHAISEASYQDFRSKTISLRLYSRLEMQQIIGGQA